MIALGALAAKRVIYIGGVSGSGKSVFAAALAAALPGRNLVKLDWIYDGLHASRTQGGIKRSRRVMARLAPAIVTAIIADALETDGCVIIEGGWVEPRAWQCITADNSAMHALFLGYPNASVAAMVERLSATGHWLSGGIASNRRFLEDQVKHSKRLRRKLAGRPGTEFVDVSAQFASLPVA